MLAVLALGIWQIGTIFDHGPVTGKIQNHLIDNKLKQSERFLMNLLVHIYSIKWVVFHLISVFDV